MTSGCWSTSKRRGCLRCSMVRAYGDGRRKSWPVAVALVVAVLALTLSGWCLDAPQKGFIESARSHAACQFAMQQLASAVSPDWLPQALADLESGCGSVASDRSSRHQHLGELSRPLAVVGHVLGSCCDLRHRLPARANQLAVIHLPRRPQRAETKMACMASDRRNRFRRPHCFATPLKTC